MMRSSPWALLALLVVLAGCGGAEEAVEAEVEPAADPGAMDGLTPEQIRVQAEPMSPAVAESLGIIDSTIHIEDPFPGDSLELLRDSAAPRRAPAPVRQP